MIDNYGSRKRRRVRVVFNTFRNKPDRIGICLHGTVLEPVLNGSKTGPAVLQVQFWIRSGPFPERSRVNRRPLRSAGFSAVIHLDPFGTGPL